MLLDFQIVNFGCAAGVEEVLDNHLGQLATDWDCRKDEWYWCLKVESFPNNCWHVDAGDAIDPESEESG
ncbi:hypothetical protein K3495_g1093 [Podosphaera aphanis]|nr:hypothetical protein K3495_g1093 [Podosphaera aphanis]